MLRSASRSTGPARHHLSTPVDLAKKRFAVGEVEIAYIDQGDGPPLVLMPGLGGDARFWVEQIPILARHFRVVAIDHRGAGASTRWHGTYSVELLAGDVVGLLDRLGIERTLYLGHSAGGAIGQVLAEDHGHRIRAIVLSATWPGSDSYIRRCFAARLQILQAHGIVAYRKAVNNVLYPPWWVSRHADDLARTEDTEQPANDDAWLLDARIAGFMAFDRRDRLGTITQPTLVVCALDDMVTPYYLSQEIARAIRGATLVTLPTGGHFVPRILPAAYTPPVLEFLLRQR